MAHLVMFNTILGAFSSSWVRIKVHVLAFMTGPRPRRFPKIVSQSSRSSSNPLKQLLTHMFL